MNGWEAAGEDGNGQAMEIPATVVQAMQIPPTFGQPPTPPTQPRVGTLHRATGPLQPSFTRQRPSAPYSVANLPCSVNPARLQPSRVVFPNSQRGRSCESSSGAGARPARWNAMYSS